MKYPITNKEKLESYYKAVELRKLNKTKEEIVAATVFPTWRVLEFFMKRNNLKLPLYEKQNNHNTKHDYFDNINTHEKAYILGFLFADGCIYNSSRFGFCITEADSSVLELIKNEICPTAKIKKILNTKGAKNRKPQCILRISSKKLVTKLKEKFGVSERKTLNEGLLLPILDEELMKSFLRGLSDGDGNFYLEGNKFRWTLCMTDKTFLEKLKKFFVNKGINIPLYERVGKTCKYYLLSTSNKKTAFQIATYMYDNNKFCLQRKKDKYLRFKKIWDNTVLNSETNESESV